MSSCHENNLAVLRARLGVEELPEDILVEALTHPSWLDDERAGEARSNQRLEFLGDAVLGLAVADYLYAALPDAPEGELTRIKSQAVSRETLAQLANQLEIGNFVLLGPEERATEGWRKPSILADCVEAIIGAVYVALGFEAARDFVIRHLGAKLNELVRTGSPLDPKTRLQHLLQEKLQRLPEYVTVLEEGPPHQRIFEVEVRFGGVVLGRGRGTSKQRAQQAAAAQALERREEWLKKIVPSEE